MVTFAGYAFELDKSRIKETQLTKALMGKALKPQPKINIYGLLYREL